MKSRAPLLAAGLLTILPFLSAEVTGKALTTEQILSIGKHGKGEAFVLKDAVPVADLKSGGFAEEPALVDHFDPGWEKNPEHWRIATWSQNKTQMGTERAVANEDGELVLTVKEGFPAKGGSIQSKKEFGWGRWVARVRPSSTPGVLNSIFTKDWDDLTNSQKEGDGKMGEIDIEFLTYTFGEDRGEVHLAIHLLNKSNLWSRDIPLDFNPSDEFHEWGFDVLPDRVVWHVDGKHLFTWIYDGENKIDPMYEFFFNAWSMEKWIKGPPKADAMYHIDWVKFYPYLGEE